MKFTRAQLEVIKQKHSSLTSKELFNHLIVNYGLKHEYTSYRTELYNKGFYKVRMRRWTAEEKQFLIDNYEVMGNIEIAEKLSKKGRVFNKKQIEKQMKLSKLRRSPEALEYIRSQHKKAGIYSEGNYRRWESKKAKEGDRSIHIQNNRTPIVKIKVNGTFIPYARYRYEKLHGIIPTGYKVYFKDCNPLNVTDSNLHILKAGELTREMRALYKLNIDKYFLEQKTKTVFKKETEVPKIIEKKENMITVVINEKIRLQVKPGTDIEALKLKYNKALQKNWEASNFLPMDLKQN
ncbi:hypothetical protein [Elizabethkingia anophelis]|uniref:hypothetical protein n=1 Tax=Elizabethkingia anophelis TaxID=1117645 RepID=UPI00320B7D2E